MSSKRRTHRELLAKMLTVCLTPGTISRMIYRVETSGTIIYKLLKDAERFKLINQTEGKYHTTEKGEAFLEAWEKATSFLKEE